MTSIGQLATLYLYQKLNIATQLLCRDLSSVNFKTDAAIDEFLEMRGLVGERPLIRQTTIYCLVIGD